MSVKTYLAVKGRSKRRDDLSRAVMIHCCKDGTITYRTRDQKVFNGRALPVFSVDTEEQAKDIQVLFCRLQYGEHPQMPGKPWYAWHDFKGTLEDLDRVRGVLAEYWYAQRKARP